MTYILQLLNPIIYKVDRLKKSADSAQMKANLFYLDTRLYWAKLKVHKIAPQLLQSNFQVLGSLIWKLKFYSIDFLRS